MRRLALWNALAILCLVFGGPAALRSETSQAHQAVRADPTTITVYVTKTGEKYHRDGCRYLSRSRIPMSLSEAAKRFGPCSVCKPPILN